MRIRGYDEETEEYSEDVATLTGTIADLTKVASNNYRGVSLFEPGDPDTYRSTYDILSDIADIWDELTDKNQATLLEVLFGKRQSQIGAAILSNFDQARSAIEKMEASAGSAEREMGKIEQSVTYKLNALKETWVGVSQNLFQTDQMGFVVDALTLLSGLIDGLTSVLGLFGTTALFVFGIQFVKGISSANKAMEAAKIAVAGLKFDPNNLNEYVYALSGLSKTQQKLVLSTTNLSKEQQDAIMKEVAAIKEKTMVQLTSILQTDEETVKNKLNIASIEELTIEKVKAALASEKITQAEYEQIIASGLLNTKNKTLSMSFKTLRANASAAITAMLKSPMTWISIVTGVISLVNGLIQKSKQAAEEARQSMTEAADAANDRRNTLADLVAEYKELATAGDFDSSARETAKRIQEDITNLVGAQADNLDLVNGKLDEEIGKLNDIRLQNAYDSRNTLDTKFRDAVSRYNKGLDSSAPATNSFGIIKYYQEIADILTLIGYENEDLENFMGAIDLDAALDGKNAQEVLDIYKEIQNVLLNTDVSFDWGVFGSSQDILNALQQQIDYYQGIIDEYYSAQKNYLENEAIIEVGEYLKTTDIDTQEAFDGYVQGIRDSTEYSEAYKQVLLDLINNTFPQFSGVMQQATNDSGTSVSVYTAQIKDLKDIISDLQSSYDALDAAEADMADGDGLSPDTIKALADAEENYLDYLYEENGMLKLNTEAWKENADAKMLSEMTEIQKEIDSLKERNAALQESIEYYEEQRNLDHSSAWTNMISDATSEIEENSKAIAENQEKLAIWESVFDRVTNAAKYADISDVLSDVAEAANKFGAESGQAQYAMQELSQCAPKTAAALYDEETGMYNLGVASEYTAESILEVAKVNLSSSIDTMKGKLAELESAFYATAISARTMRMAMEISDLKTAISEATKELDALGSIRINTSSSGSGGGSSKTQAEKIKEGFDDLNSSIEHSISLQERYYKQAEERLDTTAMRSSLLNQIAYYKQIQEEAHKAAEEIRAYYKSQGLSAAEIEAKSDIQSLSETWWKAADSIKSAMKQMSEDIVKAFSDAVDSIQDVYDTLHDAADEYAESGFITIDTLQSVCDMGLEYLAYLIDENNQLVINEERIQAIIAARTQQLAIESSLAYVEALRMAKAEGDITTLNNLLYATEQATDATWGLVYANLALAGLDESQYQAALRNINAIRAMADSAVQSIGKTVGGVTDELEKMQNGLNDILNNVMDMLKQQIQDQIDELEDMKDAYSEIIEQQKESLRASKEEADYQKTKASKVREIAKLQARIDALSLDDSREAQAEREKLMEELAELQEDLADTQSDYAYDAQEEALDKMDKAYQEEKDKEIEFLEDSISSYQKLYDMAISYVESHWSTLYSELIRWNTQYGNVLNREIATAWNNCLAAAQRYGGYVSALNNIGADIESAQNDGSNTVIGETDYSNASATEESIHAIIKEMYANSQTYHTADAAGQEYLSNRNLQLGAMLAQYGITAVRGNDGAWYVDRAGGELLFDKYRKYIYHDGGIVGGGDIKSNEQLSLLKNKEWVLSEQMVKNLSAQMERINQMRNVIEHLPTFVGKSLIPDLLRLNNGSTINNVTNNSNKPVQITFGDTVIYGYDDKTVTQHIEVTRRFANEIFGRLNIKK